MNANRLCAAAAAVALGLAACGGDDDEEAGGTTGTQEQPAPAGEPSETVELRETEFEIDPAQVNVDEAGVVEFKVENAGSVTHALEVESEDLEEETEDIAAGDTATLKVDLPAGTYELYCPIGDHKERGMTGELVVAGGRGGTGESESENESESETEDDSGY